LAQFFYEGIHANRFSVAASISASESDDSDDEGFQRPRDDREVIVDADENSGSSPKNSSLWKEEEEVDNATNDGTYQRNPYSIESSIASVLGKNTTTVQRSIRNVARFVKRHKFKTLACLGLYLTFRFASRDRLLRGLSYFISPFFSAVRNKDGQVELRLNITMIYHVIIAVAILYQAIRTINDDEHEEASSLLGTLLVGPQASHLLRRLFRPGMPRYAAYVPPIQQHFTFETLNDRYLKDFSAIAKASKNSFQPMSNIATSAAKTNSTIVVLDWTGLDTMISSLDTLKDSVSYLLSLSKSNEATFDVVVILESPGGSATRYAMAAQQLCRLRKSHHVTVCVDNVAASGGYMIACTASRIIAAPFALMGSIGVVGQAVNVHKLLDNWGVNNLVLRGGRDKAPLSIIGEVTKENVAQVQDSIDDMHRAFKRHVVENRPILAKNIEDVATGRVWVGYDALDNGLIDQIGTSDEYLLDRMQEGSRVLKLLQIKRTGPFGFSTTAASACSPCRPGLRHRVGTFVAKALVGDDSWKHITTLLSKVSDGLSIRASQRP
jgi:serine protease SohB